MIFCAALIMNLFSVKQKENLQIKGTVMQIEKALKNVRFRISKFSHSNYLQFCSNLPGKFAIFLKSSLLFNSSVVFSVYKQNFTAQQLKNLINLKTRIAVNAKISVFVICVEAIIYWLLYNQHNRTFKVSSLQQVICKLLFRLKAGLT